MPNPVEAKIELMQQIFVTRVCQAVTHTGDELFVRAYFGTSMADPSPVTLIIGFEEADRSIIEQLGVNL